jgi:hypothetical protein
MANNLPRGHVSGTIGWLLAALAWIWISAGVCRAEEGEVPVLSAENAPELAEEPARIEATIVEVKFAERRKLHFLSATPNFRAKSNLPIAIRAADFEKFRSAGIKDLAAHYLGRTIRAQGVVTRDEGQWLLVVNSPKNIEVLDKPADEKPADKLKVVDAVPARLVIANEDGKETTLTVPLPADLPRSKIALEHDAQPEAYEGVSLAALLERSGVRLGAEARGTLLGRYVVIRAQDGYAALFSLAEVDPYFSEHPAILAERVNSQSLVAKRAPLQVVVPGDKHRRRWVGQVIRIEVRNALDKPAAGKP